MKSLQIIFISLLTLCAIELALIAFFFTDFAVSYRIVTAFLLAILVSNLLAKAVLVALEE